MIHPRTAIRAYAWSILKDNVDVNERVFLNRPNPLLLEELPAITIYFNSESVEIAEGDRHIVQQYERKLNLVIDVLMEQPTDPDQFQRVEDELDLLARQVEREFHKDIFFNKQIEGYTGLGYDPGLLTGLRLLSTIPDSIESNSDRVIACQSLTFELCYLDDAFLEEKGGIFESYLMQINRVGWDEDTVDPTLIEAEGDF